ncbi:MAG: MarR family transcriptional regulator [Clostridiales bacterium]|nr:MarR family transcriptional regulator [Clostridiales bacterium]
MARKNRFDREYFKRPAPVLERMRVGMLARDVNKLMHLQLCEKEQAMGFKSSYRMILFHLFWQDGISQLRLAEKCRLKPPTVSVTLQNMEREGLVTRKISEADQREMLVYITEEGRKIQRGLFDNINSIEQKIADIFTPEEYTTLRDNLFKIRAVLLENDE